MNGDNVSLENLQQLKQIEEMKKQILTRMLSREAYERLGRVRAVNTELASQAELYLIQIHQSGKLKQRVSDEQMKDIFKVLSQKKSFSIKRV